MRDGASRGRVVPYARLYQTPYSNANQTLQITLVNEDDYDTYVEPSGYQFSKVDVLTNAIFFENIADRNLQQCFETIGTVPVMQDFRTLVDRFQWIRFKSIKVTLTPENYEGVGGDIGQDSHPILHVINDNASAAIALSTGDNPSPNYTVDAAQTLPKHQYTQYYFNKPLEFKINSVERNDGSSADKNSVPYSSYTRWTKTSGSNAAIRGTTFIPNDNFYFGFTDVPTGWQFKVKLTAVVTCKNILLS